MPARGAWRRGRGHRRRSGRGDRRADRRRRGSSCACAASPPGRFRSAPARSTTGSWGSRSRRTGRACPGSSSSAAGGRCDDLLSTPGSVTPPPATPRYVPRPDAVAGPREHAPLCAWCGAVLDPAGAHPAGRLVCRRCGAQTTWPAPTDAELDRAYGSWYRPAVGTLLGRRRRAAAAAARPARRTPRPDRARRAGARRRRRGGGPPRRPRSARADRDRARARVEPRRRAGGRARRLRPALRRRSSSGTRWSTSAMPAPSSSGRPGCSSGAGCS